MELLGNGKVAKSSTQQYCCSLCDYICSKKYNWDKHIATAKHIAALNGNLLEMAKWQKVANYVCSRCAKAFKTKSGMWKHTQRCAKEVAKETSHTIDKDELIIQLLKQNAKLMEILEHGTHNNTHNTTHTNSHNKAFNLQFFLNETCKNAMNITDFVNSIKLQLSDLMDVGEMGYVEGISKIIVKNLNNLDESERPVHCTDKKRETMYVKDDGAWNKEDNNKTKLKKAINKIADKNIRLLPAFREKYPEYNNAHSKHSDVHDKLVIEVMQTDDDKKDKIIHNISKFTCIK